MSGTQNSAPDSAYLLNHPFTMPSDDGGMWAIAFSSRTGTLLTAVFAVVLLIMFALLWTFICFLAVLLGGNWASGDVSETRYGAMVTLWNSDDSLLASKRMVRYSYHSLYPEYKPAKGADNDGSQPAVRKWGDFTYGITIAFIAICVYVGAIVVGILGPGFIQIGNVAPVRPSVVFYPQAPNPAIPEQTLQNFGLLAPAALRAIGSVESASEEDRSKVNIDPDILGTTPDGGQLSLEYDYKLSGVDFGLQHASKLHLSVTGFCTTVYDWWTSDANDTETYTLWPELSKPAVVPVGHNPTEIKFAPRAAFVPHPHATSQLIQSSNVSFAVLVSSAHRASISKGSDPWYTTELRPTDIPPAQYNATHWMKLRRPVLSCWQHDAWSYNSHPAQSVHNLSDLPDLHLPPAIHDIFLNAFSIPMVANLGNTIGDSALRSRTTSPRGVIDAAKSSIYSDMERLIVASYIASRDVFAGTVSFPQDGGGSGGYPNVLRGSNGLPAEGAGDIVVASPEVQTFSMVGLVALAGILGFLMAQAWLISWLVHGHSRRAVERREATVGGAAGEKKMKKKTVWARFSALEAPRLFNDAFDAVRERKCEVPSVARSVSFVKCTADNCPGHAVVSLGCESDEKKDQDVGEGKVADGKASSDDKKD